jgi:dipeptidyl aminopeptidase/acylaminoacyl peptidase
MTRTASRTKRPLGQASLKERIPRCFVISVGILAVAMLTRTLNASTSQAAELRWTHESEQPAQSADRTDHAQPLTVADSIQMTHFIDPPENDDAVHPKFSPDGKSFLIVTERGDLDSNLREYSLVIYSSNEPEARPLQGAVFRSSSNRDGISQAKWLTNENIAFVGENPGEAPQVYVANRQTLKIQKLTSDPLGVVAYDVSRDATTVIYTAHWGGYATEVMHKDQHGFAITDEQLSDLTSGEWQRPSTVFQTYILNTSNGKIQAVHGGPFAAGFWVLKVWLSPDGRYAITERPVFPIPESWESYEGWVGSEAHSLRVSAHSQFQVGAISEGMLVSTDTGDITPLTDSPAGSRFSVVWSSDSRSAIVGDSYLPLENSGKEELARRRAHSVVAEFSIPSRSFRRIAEIPKKQLWSLEGGGTVDTFIVRIREESRVLPTVAYRHEGDKWIEESGGHVPGETHPDIRITQALDRWPRVAVIDSAAHQERVISDPNPQFQYRQFGRVQTIRWVGKLGEAWVGGLVYPTNYVWGARYPLVIQTHGFDPDRFLVDGSFTTAMAAQELANKGIAVLLIGETPLDEEVSQKPEEGKAYVSAYESAVDYLDKLGIIDCSRVGLIGFSRTSYHVKYALTHSHYHFTAATAAEGIDFGYWQYIAEANLPIYIGAYHNMYGGAPWQGNWKPWMEHSVSFNLDKIDTPLRLEAEDNPGAILNEWETFAALRLLNKPVDLIFIPHGDHPLVKPWERMTSQQGNVDWFVFWLKGEEDPDPAKAEQYVRWRQLRNLQQENDRKLYGE